MADTLVTTNKLNLLAVFADGDDRTIELDNPRDNITESDITSLNTFVKNKNLLVSDKTGAAFSHFRLAETKSNTRTILDLSD